RPENAATDKVESDLPSASLQFGYRVTLTHCFRYEVVHVIRRRLHSVVAKKRSGFAESFLYAFIQRVDHSFRTPGAEAVLLYLCILSRRDAGRIGLQSDE